MANITNINTVVLPAHLYAHTETRINDNTIRTYSRSANGNCNVLAVIMSPKGEDGVITTVSNGLEEFDEKFGVGPYSIYGQPLINARASAYTNCATLRVLRITADDATYANNNIFVSYKIEEIPGTEPETTKKVMKVRFIPSSSNKLQDLDKMDAVAALPEDLPDDDGWTNIDKPFLSVAYVGKGLCGNNISFRISNHPRADKTNAYKNYYFTVFENTTQKEEFKISFTPDAIVNGNSIFIENVVNKFGGVGSDYVRVKYNEQILPELYNVYKSEVDPKTTLTQEEFDPFLGINKRLASLSSSKYNSFAESKDIAISNFEIVSENITIDDSHEIRVAQLNGVFGNALSNGSDGIFDISTPKETRDAAISDKYIDAFEGKIDRDIMSKYRCPLDVVFDANFPKEVKYALANFTAKREEDFRTYFDLGIDELERDSAFDASMYDTCINFWTMSIDAYYGKIKDPYNQKIIPVTSTYNLSLNLPYHWKKYGGKHIPYAGSKYGIIDNYIKGSIYPVYDDSIDQKILDRFVDEHVNFAKIDAKGNVIRGSQTTRYNGLMNAFEDNPTTYTVSNLSEENNCHIVLDIKKDAEKLVANYSYNFNEASDIALFNREAESITAKYQAAQVKSITASFSRTDEEAELGVLHMYIAVQHKALVKYIQIDIDVNRNVSE